jgi:hypothetical protein
VQPLATSAVTGASREALLSQRSELSSEEAQKLALFGLSGSDDQSTASEQ